MISTALALAPALSLSSLPSAPPIPVLQVHEKLGQAQQEMAEAHAQRQAAEERDFVQQQQVPALEVQVASLQAQPARPAEGVLSLAEGKAVQASRCHRQLGAGSLDVDQGQLQAAAGQAQAS